VYYHVRVTKISERDQDEVKLDLDEAGLEKQFLAPYREGRPIIVGGTTIPSSDIYRIRISQSGIPSAQILPLVRQEHDQTGYISFKSDEWHVVDKGADVTDEFIKGPPGYGSPHESGLSLDSVPVPDARKVFVVHGRNSVARDAMFIFLRSLHLEPIEFNEAIAATRKGSPYIGEVLNFAFDRAQAVIVLFTPDDEARLREVYHSSSDPQHEKELTGQARPNVIFEAGMALGRSEDRTVLVELGSLRPFSDVGGRHVIRMDGTSQRRQELAQRLLASGCDVNMNGIDWHSAGNFESAVDN
jgi:predicted nucleotide-binding protein